MADIASSVPGQPVHKGVFSRLARGQYVALAWVQTRIFVHSLHTRRGSFELGARILTYFLFGLFAIGPAVGLGTATWGLVADGHLQSLALPLWVLAAMWQFFSALAPALAGQNPDLSHLLRFPVSFGSWILLYLLYGLVAPSTIIGILWTAAVGIGVIVARPDAWAAILVTLALFALFNLLLSRMILAWIERWMAQRRSREIITAIFLFAVLAAQAFNPAFHQHRRGLPFGLTHRTIVRTGHHMWAMERILPPGLAADSIVRFIQHQNAAAAEGFGALAGYAAVVAALLALRLRTESRGESLSEAPRPTSPARSRVQASSRRWLDFSSPVAAVFEKDLRYVLRSGPMLYNLAAPVVMLFIFGGTMFRSPRVGVWYGFALPMGMAWAFFGLTRFVCNSFGGEAAGIQFYYLSPTPMRTVLIGKNLLHLALFLLEASLLSTIVILRFGVPGASMIVGTVAWLLFALPMNFAAGNALSIRMSYRMDMTRISSGQGALGNGLLSMLLQFGIVAAGALVLVPCDAFGHPWLAVPILLVLAALGVATYLRVLDSVNGMMKARAETLMQELVKLTAAH